nr:cysteine-rich receptor-like protein kinase [Tanacetum cinerariifolium]
LIKKTKNDNKEEESSKATLKYPKDVQDVEDVVEVQENTQKSDKQDNFSSILYAWDPKMFHKHNATISDYFVAIQGEWIANANKYLGISVYAPQEASEKRMLWSYLNHVIDRFIIDTWSNMSISDTNVISKFMKKLRHLKLQARLWVRDKKESDTTKMAQLKGNWIEDPNSIKNEFFSHFKERFDIPCSSRLMLEGEFSNKLSVDQSIDLESNVTIEEIKMAVWDCGIDKSPEPDGFTFGFYRRYWDIIKNDVADAVSLFFIPGNFPKGGNSSFIALIPKMQYAKVLKDYRPISLIGSLYKIIAKILANRLVEVLGELVNEVQSVFIVNRQILDGPFILDELIHWCHAKKKETMIFKVDFEKAYDSVRWDYLDDVLNKIYALESDKNLTVTDKMAHNDTAFSLRRQPRDGVEMEQFRALSIVIEGVLLHDMVDRWKRTLEGSGEFSVASARKFIDNSLLIGSPKKTRWIKMVPIKVNILAWKVQFDLLPTRLNLSRRGVEIQNICCSVCNKQVESMNHLFFACSLARDIYRKIALWWELTYSEFHSYEEWLAWFCSLMISSKHKELLEGIYYAMWWQ